MKKWSFLNKFVLIAGLVLASQGFAANCAADYVPPENPVWDGSTKTEPCTKDRYYIIDNAAKLAWYGANYNSGNAKLTADIDLGGHLWIPLAAGKGDKFYGKIFDGQNHIIKNLYVNGDDLSALNKEYAQNLGFVGVLGDGKVLNLVLENVDIQATTNAGTIISNQDNQISVGAVVGWMSDKGTNVVDNCITSGTIKTTGKSQGVGGIVGNAKKGTYSWAKDYFSAWHRSKVGLLDDAIESYSDGVPRAVFDKHLVDEAETIAKFTTMRELLLHIAKIAEAEGFV